MKIKSVDILAAGMGWRNIYFVKMASTSGAVGWSEFRGDAGNFGLHSLIQEISTLIVGRDPRNAESISAFLRARTTQTSGGLTQQAIAAIVNCCLDLKAKDLGVQVRDLFGGTHRTSVPYYWSHFATLRLRHAELIGVKPVRVLEDLVQIGSEVQRLGIKAIKTSIMTISQGHLGNFGPGFAWTDGWPALDWNQKLLDDTGTILAHLRTGVGPEVAIMLDVNNHFRLEGLTQLVQQPWVQDLHWLEMDDLDPASLASVRHRCLCPIASCEKIYGMPALVPHLAQRNPSVLIIDATWNGLLDALKMATIADAFGLNVAPHSYGGPLGELIALNFSAMLPNLKLLEVDVDDVPWKYDLITQSPIFANGMVTGPKALGWGAEVDEAAVRRYPPR